MKAVAPIPEGYNSVTPYLIVNDAAQAIEFYKKAFNAIEVMRMNMPNQKIAHAELKIGDSKIMLADEFPEMGAKGPKAFGGSPISIHLYVKDVDHIVDQAVKAGGKLIKPLEDMFYGDRTGALEDPYGHKWHVATHVEDVSDDEIKKRSAALFSK